MPRFGHIHKGLCFQCEGATIVRLPKAAERVVLRATGQLQRLTEAVWQNPDDLFRDRTMQGDPVPA
jgi:hypothetical protein